jgi:hypothetical protein
VTLGLSWLLYSLVFDAGHRGRSQHLRPTPLTLRPGATAPLPRAEAGEDGAYVLRRSEGQRSGQFPVRLAKTNLE